MEEGDRPAPQPGAAPQAPPRIPHRGRAARRPRRAAGEPWPCEVGFDLAGVALPRPRRASWPSSPSGSPAATRARWRYLTSPGRAAQRPAHGLPVGALGRLRRRSSTTRRTPTRPRRRRDRGLDRALRLGRRLPRRDEGAARAPGRARSRPRPARFSRAHLRGHRADRGARLRGRGGARGLGQEHLPAAPRARLVVLPGRGRDRPRAGAGRAAHRHVRQLHRLPRRLPHRRAPRALRARRHALHQLPDHRGEGRDPGGAARRASAGTSSAATSARTCARGTASDARRDGPPSSRAPGSLAPDLAELAGLDDGRLPRALPPEPGEARQAPRACCATSRWPSATPATASRPVLERLPADDDPLVREHAKWALARLGQGSA